jgi:hypothetical protein
VLVTVAVTAGDAGRTRARVEKRKNLRRAGIPVQPADRQGQLGGEVHGEPDGVRYVNVRVVPFGKSVARPDPVGSTLDTELSKQRVR